MKASDEIEMKGARENHPKNGKGGNNINMNPNNNNNHNNGHCGDVNDDREEATMNMSLERTVSASLTEIARNERVLKSPPPTFMSNGTMNMNSISNSRPDTFEGDPNLKAVAQHLQRTEIDEKGEANNFSVDSHVHVHARDSSSSSTSDSGSNSTTSSSQPPQQSQSQQQRGPFPSAQASPIAIGSGPTAIVSNGGNSNNSSSGDDACFTENSLSVSTLANSTINLEGSVNVNQLISQGMPPIGGPAAAVARSSSSNMLSFSMENTVNGEDKTRSGHTIVVARHPPPPIKEKQQQQQASAEVKLNVKPAHHRHFPQQSFPPSKPSHLTSTRTNIESMKKPRQSTSSGAIGTTVSTATNNSNTSTRPNVNVKPTSKSKKTTPPTNNTNNNTDNSAEMSSEDKNSSENGSDGGYAASASSNSGTCSSPSLSSSDDRPRRSSEDKEDFTTSRAEGEDDGTRDIKRKSNTQTEVRRTSSTKRIRKSGDGTPSFSSSDIADFSTGGGSGSSSEMMRSRGRSCSDDDGSDSPRMSSCSSSLDEERLMMMEEDLENGASANAGGTTNGNSKKITSTTNKKKKTQKCNACEEEDKSLVYPKSRTSRHSRAHAHKHTTTNTAIKEHDQIQEKSRWSKAKGGAKTTGLDSGGEDSIGNASQYDGRAEPSTELNNNLNPNTALPRNLVIYDHHTRSSPRRRIRSQRSTPESLQEKQHNELKATFQSALKQLDSTSTASTVAYAKMSSLDTTSTSSNNSSSDERGFSPVRISSPDPSNRERSPIYDMGVDMMASILSYLEPIEVYSLLVMPLSKTWRMRITIPQDLWKVLCLSDPFNARLEATSGGGGGSDDSASSYPICSKVKVKHVLGRYRLLYSSFIRCFRYLNKIKERKREGKLRMGKNDIDKEVDSDNENVPRTFAGNSKLKNFFAKAKKTRYGHSKLTQRLLGPAGRVAGDTELHYSCAIYSVVNWMVAFTDVAGIQTSCCEVLPSLLEDENQRTAAQHAGLTDIVLRAMVLFPDISALHTAAFHTLVLLARPLGGKEGEIFHTSMVNSSAIFDSGSSTGRSGIAVMLDSMKRFSKDENLQAMGCWSMVNIALIPSQKVVLVKLGGISVATNSMMQHPFNAEVQFRALFALINLVIPSENLHEHSTEAESIREQVGGVNERSEQEMLNESVGQITNLVVVSMKNFWSSEAILNRACLVLHNLSLNENYHNVLLWTPNCYQMLEWCIENYKNDAVLQQSATNTLQRLQMTLANDDDLRQRFTESLRAQQQTYTSS